MYPFEPVTAHAPLGENDYCDAHDEFDDPLGMSPERRKDLTALQALHRKMALDEPRIWQVTASVKSTLVHPQSAFAFREGLHESPSAFVLWRGTRLRLDTVHGYLDGKNSATIWRFCVLDGPLAGTCWYAEAWIARDDSSHTRDPVEPIAASTQVLQTEHTSCDG